MFHNNKGRGRGGRTGSDFSPVRGPALLFCKSYIIVSTTGNQRTAENRFWCKIAQRNWLASLFTGRGELLHPWKTVAESLLKCSSSLFDARCLGQHRLLLVKHNWLSVSLLEQPGHWRIEKNVWNRQCVPYCCKESGLFITNMTALQDLRYWLDLRVLSLPPSQLMPLIESATFLEVRY